MEAVLSLQPTIPPKRFDIFPLTGGCSEGLDALLFSLDFSFNTIIIKIKTLQEGIPRTRPTLTGGCSEGLDTLVQILFQHHHSKK